MSIYNLDRSKSLKKHTQINSKSTHVLPQSISQTNRQSVVNLSKLGTYKGKFSLTSKYSSLSSQNNHESVRQSQQVPHSKGQYMSQCNKQNIFSRANVITDEFYEKKSQLMSQTDKICFENEIYDHKRNLKRNLINQSKHKPLDQARNQMNAIKTQPIHEESQEEKQNMKKIIMAASSFNFKNPQQKNKSINACNQSVKTEKPYANDKHSIQDKQRVNLSKDKNAKSVDKSVVAQRRSKFHKYDNSADENEFLVIEQEASPLKVNEKKMNLKFSSKVYEKKSSIQQKSKVNDKKASIQKKVPKRQGLMQKKQLKSPYPPEIHTQTIKLDELALVKHTSQVQTQLQGYKESIKHIIYSMIKMISLIGKLQTSEPSFINNERNLKIMGQIQQEIFAIHNKELGKYVDKLRIRQQLMGIARQEEQFVTNSMDVLEGSQQSVVDAMRHKEPHKIHIKSQDSNHYDQSIYDQGQSCVQDSADSLLHEYEIRQSCSDQNSSNNHSFNNPDVNSQQQLFFDFDSFKHLEIMPSGRNLLQTFNNQHLTNELQVIDNHLMNELQQSNGNQLNQLRGNQLRQERDYNKIQNHKIQILHQNTNFSKKPFVQKQKQNKIDPQTLKKYEENLSYGLRQLKIEQASPSQQQNLPTKICRKLFNQQPSVKPTDNLSPINHVRSTNSILCAHNQNLHHCPQTLLPDNYYEIVCSSTQTLNESSSNYLKLKKGEIIKLLRKVDKARWIAELEDKIGFVEQESVIQTLRLIGVTATKNTGDMQDD